MFIIYHWMHTVHVNEVIRIKTPYHITEKHCMGATTSDLEDVYTARETNFEWSEKMLSMTCIR